jgi:hypothetical protein
MMDIEPLRINFESAPGLPSRTDAVRLPKIYQGAPYEKFIRVKNADDGTYRDFTGFDEMIMQVRLGQNDPVLFQLKQSDGELIGEVDKFTFKFDAAKTETLTLPICDPFQTDVRFVYDVEFVKDSVVVERFAYGTGFIVINTTR